METTRVMDICKHNDFCGGCKYQELSYSEQLKLKQEEVKELLKVDRVNPEVFADIEGCPIESQYRYRNKMEYTFGDMLKDGPLCLGMHKIKNFMSIVTVDNCQLVSEDFNKILLFTLNFCTEKGYTKYHKRSHKGLLRNLIVRRGFRTGEIIVNIVTSTESEFAEKEWVEGLLGLCLNDDIVGIMHTLNDNLADAVNCDELRLLHGKDYYMEEILELKFKVHEFAFFQTNVEACERLYSQAIDLIDNLEGKNVFDLYCGTGTISQIMAKRAAKVTGVEIVQESVESAIENARLNNLDNCNFICGDVFEVLESITEKPDVIVVDPPRVGMSPDVVEKLCSYGVEQIVYISCNPKTLTKNLYHFQLLGYEVKYLKPFDNFPMTKHTEVVALLSKI